LTCCPHCSEWTRASHWPSWHPGHTAGSWSTCHPPGHPGPSPQSCSPAAPPQPVLVPGVVPPQVQDPALALVEHQVVSRLSAGKDRIQGRWKLCVHAYGLLTGSDRDLSARWSGDGLSSGRRRSSTEYQDLENFTICKSSTKSLKLLIALRHCQRQQQMDGSFHPARHFHVFAERWAKSFVSASFLLCKCVNITKRILPVNNTVTLNKDLITQTVINLFKTNAVLLLEADLPTHLSSVC